MQPFEYHSPRSLPEALRLLQELGDGARLIAGGTDLLLRMKQGQLAPRALIDLRRAAELHGISFSPEEGLRIGAAVTLRELQRSPLVRDHCPCLCETASWMASEQVRSLATVGGNLCNASPAADLAPPLMVLDAQAVLVGPQGERRLPVEAFFLGPGQTALDRGELLKEVLVPPTPGNALYLKHAPRAFMDIAVVGVAVHLRMERGLARAVRIALGAVGPTPLRAGPSEALLEGSAPTASLLEEAADLAARACSPIDDLRGSAWYRRRMVRVLTRRALDRLCAASLVGEGT